MDIQELRTRRIELEEEIELWQSQIALTNHQVQQDNYDGVSSSKVVKRQHRNAQDSLRTCLHKLNILKNEMVGYTAQRLGLTDYYKVK